jgi:hypothetical protein
MSTLERSAAPRRWSVPIGTLLRGGMITIIAAVIVNVVIWAIVAAVLRPPADFLPLASPMPAALFTTLFLIPAIIVYAIVVRLSASPVRMYQRVAVVALVLSIIPNILAMIDPSTAPMPGFTPAYSIALMLMHVAAWAVTVNVLPRFAPPTPA